ncbi:AAA family ATPase [Kribbella sp. NPDC058693]|uniref:AAA family ATPase n=1 Tax=Kribbella sp. NPDC058693 TaxID=3346602 RepID=UPI00365EB898
MTRVLAFVNLKGGSAKTTCAAFVAHALAALGLRVCVVDADPQGSTLEWHGLAEWNLPVLGLPSNMLHRQLWGVVDRSKFDVVVIDSPPLEEREGIVYSILRVATDVLVPMAPTPIEHGRLAAVWRAIDAAEAFHDVDRLVAVLLNRAVANAASTKTYRELIQEDGHRVMEQAVPRLELYAQAFGEPVPADDPAFGKVAGELEREWKVAA